MTMNCASEPSSPLELIRQILRKWTYKAIEIPSEKASLRGSGNEDLTYAQMRIY